MLKPSEMHHVVVYRSNSHFSGWPFNGGFWQFADGELAVGFIRGSCDYSTPESVKHRVVDNLNGEHLIVRSNDGGESWPEDTISWVYKRPEFDEEVKSAPYSLDAAPSVGPIGDPKADGFCLISGYGIPPEDAPDAMFVLASSDRGHSWSSPVRMKSNGFVFLGGRPSYLVRPDGMLLLFGHGDHKHDDRIRVPLVFASSDCGRSWGILAEMTPVPEYPNAIMPYPLQLPSGIILAAIRRQYPGGDAYAQIYRSVDGGQTWLFYSRVNDWGAPSSLTMTGDGRIACVYGYRRPPFGIRARMSSDGGLTWGEEIVLRDDGGSGDLGYPRTILRPDGLLVTAYYFNRDEENVRQRGGVRHIAATIWKP